VDDCAFIRYLAAKKSVDDRSLNAGVWRAMTAGLPAAPRILEVAGGIGTMVERVAADGRISPSLYRMTDAQSLLVGEARRRLSGLRGFPVELEVRELGQLLASAGAEWDLVIASAFLDIVDWRAALPGMRSLARPGGRFLFSINFDGVTSFSPEIDRDLDARIEAAYHATMDERPTGDSRCGRHLLGELPRFGYRVEAAGSSDWVVFPRGGGYTADERLLLACMLDFHREALEGRPEVAPEELEEWLRRRRAHLEAGELGMVVHHLDVLAGCS
jgi:hypothetical protein